MAKKNQLNVSIGVDGANYKKDWDKIASITQGAAKDLEKEAAKMALAVAKKIEGMNLNSQARQLQNLTARMMEAGMQGTKAFTQVASSAGKLKANIDDAKGVIEAFRPDAPFKALSTTLGAAAQGFAGVQGAMALFGAESEETQKVLLKVQAAMAFSEGFKALDGLQDGFTQLNAVIKANPLIASVAIFTAAAAAFYAISQATDETAESQERLNIVQGKVFDSTIKEKTEIGALMARYNDANTTYNEKLSIQNKLVDLSPEYLGAISTEKVETDKVNAAVVGYIKVLELKAKAQAFQELYIDALKKEQEAIADIGGTWDNFLTLIDPFQRIGEKGLSQMESAAAGAGMEAAKMLATYQKLSTAADVLAQKQKDLYGDKPNNAPKKNTAKPAEKIVPIGQQVDDIIKLDKSWRNYSDALSRTERKSELFDVKPIQSLTDATDLSTKKYIDNAEAIKKGNDALRNRTAIIEDAEKIEARVANIQAVAEGAAGAFNTLGSVIANSMMQAAGDSANAFDVLKAKIVETIIQLAGMAMANVIVGATQSGTATGPAAIFTTPAFIATAMAGLTSAFAAAASFKPKGFASGGLIGGNSFTGDRLLAPVNSGEVILNTGQQNALLRMANGGGGGGSWSTKFTGRELIIMYDNARRDLGRG